MSSPVTEGLFPSEPSRLKDFAALVTLPATLAAHALEEEPYSSIVQGYSLRAGELYSAVGCVREVCDRVLQCDGLPWAEGGCPDVQACLLGEEDVQGVLVMCTYLTRLLSKLSSNHTLFSYVPEVSKHPYLQQCLTPSSQWYTCTSGGPFYMRR